MKKQIFPVISEEDFLDDIDMDAEIRVVPSPGSFSALCQSKFKFLSNPKISLTAKGIYMFLYERSVNSLQVLMDNVPDPEIEIRSGLEELKEFKYVEFDGIDLITIIK